MGQGHPTYDTYMYVNRHWRNTLSCIEMVALTEPFLLGTIWFHKTQFPLSMMLVNDSKVSFRSLFSNITEEKVRFFQRSIEHLQSVLVCGWSGSMTVLHFPPLNNSLFVSYISFVQFSKANYRVSSKGRSLAQQYSFGQHSALVWGEYEEYR